ncbi:MAG: mechanosensitive ion channel [Roseitalea porphyridii]|uniref:mechanosensitive ion channel family protein n=1 Tax=Roseitalea porphyridii TaxID=1852022 RepID=UPI0032ED04D8
MLVVRLILLLVVLSVGAVPAVAQQIGQDEENRVVLLARDVERLVNDIDESLNDDARLAEIATELAALQDALLAAGVDITPRLGAVRSRLDQIGPVPPESEPPEPQTLIAEREALTEERALINTLIARLEGESIAARNAIERITERRRELFTETLSRRFEITQAFGPELVDDLADRALALERRIVSWASFTWRTKSQIVLAAAIALIALAIAFWWILRRTVSAWIARPEGEEPPTAFARITNAFWYTLIPTLALWAFLAFALGGLDTASLLRPDIFAILSRLLLGIAAILLVWRLAEAVLAPSKPNWRLITVTDGAARSLKAFAVAMAVVTVADLLVAQISDIVGTSLPITIARSLIVSLAVGVLLIVIAFIRPRPPEHDEENAVLGPPRPWPGWIKWPLVALGAMLILAALAGYIGFARFAAQQIVITGAVLATIYLGYRTAQAIATDHAFAESRMGTAISGRLSLSETAVDQIGLALGIALTIIVFLIGLPVLALLWGFQWPEIRAVGQRLFTDIPVGSISISLTSIFVGIALFFVGYFMTRRFQNWLDGKVLERSRVEQGLRNSIKTAIGYLGIAIAALIGISAAGFDLSQLALVAGALSLGIGFGLQNIVSNFVSGLILLAERPFKTGDIIEAGGFTGTVTNISVRATEIQLFDRKTLILPNSDLINSPVSNWMHRNTLGRVIIPIGVSYASDPQQVHDMLLEIAADHPRILGNPEPFVSFDDFGASSLDFTLYAYLADIGFGLTVRTELRMAIVERFRAAGIEIPFPQRDVNLRMVHPETDTLPVTPQTEGFGEIETSDARRIEED